MMGNSGNLTSEQYKELQVINKRINVQYISSYRENSERLESLFKFLNNVPNMCLAGAYCSEMNLGQRNQPAITVFMTYPQPDNSPVISKDISQSFLKLVLELSENYRIISTQIGLKCHLGIWNDGKSMPLALERDNPGSNVHNMPMLRIVLSLL